MLENIKPHLTVKRQKAEKQLSDRIAKAEELAIIPIANVVDLLTVIKHFREWDQHNYLLLESIFSSTGFARDYQLIKQESVIASKTDVNERYYAFSADVIAIRENFHRKSEWLSMLRDTLHIYDKTGDDNSGDEFSTSRQVVFIVHIHDDAHVTNVSALIKDQGLEPYIVQDKPDGGRTMLTHFDEKFRDIGFVVYVLTDEFIGTLMPEHVSQMIRAKQNLIYEMGQVTARIGKGRIALLWRGETGIPMDLDGVTYHKIDDKEVWKRDLLKAMEDSEIRLKAPTA
jgi:predicted nucleotide-binding protein